MSVVAGAGAVRMPLLASLAVLDVILIATAAAPTRVHRRLTQSLRAAEQN